MPKGYNPYNCDCMLMIVRLKGVEYIYIYEGLYVGLRNCSFYMYYARNIRPSFWCWRIPTAVSSPQNGLVSSPSPNELTWNRAPCLVRLTTWYNFDWVGIVIERRIRAVTMVKNGKANFFIIYRSIIIIINHIIDQYG